MSSGWKTVSSKSPYSTLILYYIDMSPFIPVIRLREEWERLVIVISKLRNLSKIWLRVTLVWEFGKQSWSHFFFFAPSSFLCCWLNLREHFSHLTLTAERVRRTFWILSLGSWVRSLLIPPFFLRVFSLTFLPSYILPSYRPKRLLLSTNESKLSSQCREGWSHSKINVMCTRVCMCVCVPACGWCVYN